MDRRKEDRNLSRLILLILSNFELDNLHNLRMFYA